MQTLRARTKCAHGLRSSRNLHPGVLVVGAHASDLAAQGAVAIEFSASAEDLARSVHAHPTLSEIIKEAALDVAGRVIYI